MPAAKAKLVRFAAGEVKITARKAGFSTAATTVKAIAGTESMAALTLTETPKRAEILPPITQEPSSNALVAVVNEEPRSRIGAIANVHVSVYPKLGSAWLV